MNTELQKYISIDPEIHHGEPCITGTRIPVSLIVGSIANGMTFDEILAEYPQLSTDAIEAALSYQENVARKRLSVLRGKLRKGKHREKCSLEILSEMRR